METRTLLCLEFRLGESTGREKGLIGLSVLSRIQDILYERESLSWLYQGQDSLVWV